MNSEVLNRRRYRFGIFQLDTFSGELYKHGIRIKLQDQPCQVLTILLERGGEMVTREELRQRLWDRDTYVDFDHSLNISINKLRESLGDSAANPRFIETLPRKGYRFIAAVSVEEEKADVTPAIPPQENRSPALSLTSPNENPLTQLPPSKRWKLLVALGLLGVAVSTAILIRWKHPEAEQSKAPNNNRVMLAILPFEDLTGGKGAQVIVDLLS